MGNRAVITNEEKKIGIYLHYNGGRDSVEAFLLYCKLKGVRDLYDDPQYGFARMCQIIGNFFGGTTSIGIGLYEELDTDNYDNGVYVIDKNWNIVKRLFKRNKEQYEHDLFKMLREIDLAQPEGEKLGDEILNRGIAKENNVE